jgi:hypothetical protein
MSTKALLAPAPEPVLYVRPIAVQRIAFIIDTMPALTLISCYKHAVHRSTCRACVKRSFAINP